MFNLQIFQLKQTSECLKILIHIIISACPVNGTMFRVTGTAAVTLRQSSVYCHALSSKQVVHLPFWEVGLLPHLPFSYTCCFNLLAPILSSLLCLSMATGRVPHSGNCCP